MVFATKTGIYKNILRYLNENFDLSIFQCTKHDTKDLFLQYTVKLFIYTWIKNINNILKGRNSNKQFADELGRLHTKSI